jgi:hypothetical protein
VSESCSRNPGGRDGGEAKLPSGTITFHGASCDALKGGQVTDIDVVFGCPLPTPA